MHWNWQRNLAAFAVLLFGGCSAAYAQSQAAKVVLFRLGDYGWRPLSKSQQGEWHGTRNQRVAIDHKGRILVGFAARENADLATREHPALSFHILRFTSEGKLDRSLVVPTEDYFTNGLYLGPNDQIFARANDAFQVLSEQNAAGTYGAVWRSLIPCSTNCWIHQSPSRQTLIISESKDGSGVNPRTALVEALRGRQAIRHIVFLIPRRNRGFSTLAPKWQITERESRM